MPLYTVQDLLLETLSEGKETLKCKLIMQFQIFVSLFECSNLTIKSRISIIKHRSC